jgi:hypothetical protein
LTQFFSRQQTKRFLARQDRTIGLFRLETKIYLAEMKPLPKPASRMPLMVMRQKPMRFPFAWSARVREKRLNAAWKIYVSGPLNGELP